MARGAATAAQLYCSNLALFDTVWPRVLWLVARLARGRPNLGSATDHVHRKTGRRRGSKLQVFAGNLAWKRGEVPTSPRPCSRRGHRPGRIPGAATEGPQGCGRRRMSRAATGGRNRRPEQQHLGGVAGGGSRRGGGAAGSDGWRVESEGWEAIERTHATRGDGNE